MTITALTIRAALVAASVAIGSALASAQAPAPQVSAASVPGDRPIMGLSVRTSQAIAAKVTGVDPANRTVSLTLTNGTNETHKVSAIVDLGQVKPGDAVLVTYKERLTFVASEPNAPIPKDHELIAVAAIQHPEQPLGAVLTKAARNYYVVSADAAAKTLALVDVNGGEVRTFTVDDTIAQHQLPILKPGYKLTVHDSEFVVVGIQKAT